MFGFYLFGPRLKLFHIQSYLEKINLILAAYSRIWRIYWNNISF